MPNLVGVCELGTPADLLQPVLQKMIDAVDLPAFSMARRSVCGRGVAVGNVLPGTEDNLSQPARDAERGVWLMLDGELWNAPDVARALRVEGVDASRLDDAQLALAAYRAWGESFVDRLQGPWNIVLHHEAERRTVVITDRIGSRLLFMARDGARVTFGSQLKGVIAGRPVPSRPGGYGLFELLIGSYQLQETTWVEGIEALPPGSVTRIDPGGVRTHRYRRLSFNEETRLRSEDELAEALGARLRVAVARCMRAAPSHPVGITLSGGLDSRSLALAIPPGRRPIPALTYGDADSADVLYARQLAEVIGLDFHHVEGQKPRLVDESLAVLDEVLGPARRGRRGFFSAQIDRMVWTDECLGDMTGTASMIWHPLYSRHMNVMLQGAAGDALTGSHLRWAWMKGATRDQVIDDLFRETYFQPRSELERILQPSFVARFWEDRRARFERLFEDIDADEPCAVASVWDMENRQRRGAFSTFGVERYFCAVRAPFIDHEVVDLLTSVPARGRFQQRVYKKMIVRCYPEAAHVPWAYTRGRITDSASYEFFREWSNYWIRRGKKACGIGGSGPPAYAFRDNVTLLREDPELAAPVEAWIRSGAFDDTVFNPDGVRALVAGFLAGEGGEDRAIAFAYVCALARAVPWFCAGSIPSVPPEADPARFGVQPAPPRVLSGRRP